MRKDVRHAKATFGRVLSRRAFVISAVLAIAVIGLVVSGFRERAAQAASPQATPTPTPGPTPDYSKVDDILNGRRHLLRTDDVIVSGADNDGDPVFNMFFQTLSQSKTGAFINANELPIGGSSNPGLAEGPVIGRMFDLPHDVVATALYRNSDGSVGVFVSDIVTGKSSYTTVVTGAGDTSYPNRFMMADFNGDGYQDLVLNYTLGNGKNYTAVFTAKDVKNFDAGISITTTTKTTRIYNMAVGDFNGDGRPEIIGVEAGEDGTGIRLAYHTVDPNTFAISDGAWLTIKNPLSQPGRMMVIAPSAGRFTDADHDQIFVAYYTNAEYFPGSNGVKAFVIDFDASMQAQLGPVLDTRTTPNGPATVVKVRTGRFDWSSQYDQVAFMVAWWGDPKPNGQQWNTKWLEVDTVNPKDLSIKRNKLSEFSDVSCGYDIAVGNFDRRQNSADEQSPRDPDLQVSLVSGDCTDDGGNTLYVDSYSVDPQNNFEISVKAFPAVFRGSYSNIRVSAGDTQGRSVVLGEPTKITIEGTAQPTAVIAAPPMHVDFMAPVSQTAQSVINLSAVPEGFNTFFDFDSSSTSSSSTTHTTSWTFSAKESVGGSGTFGVPILGSSTVKDTFTAAQKLKGSTEKEQGSYQKLDVDISQKTGLSDQVSYSETRFNIWVYPVIGQTVCPATKPNCEESEKVPLTMELSGPDQISNNTIAGSQLEWYQPTWEYGNVLSYPGSLGQLQQIVPDLVQLSSNQTWFTDTSQLTQKTSWSNGSSTSQSSSFKQNYSFENDLSVSSSFGVEGEDASSFEADLDIGGSFGFSSLNKSSSDLSKSNGIGINKPGTFADPFSYGYNITPYIFGHKEPDGSIDNVPLTGDIQTSGLLQTAFVVDPLSGSAGGWWKQAYTAAPDVALNHPTRWVVTTPGLSNPMIPANCLATGTGASQMDCVNLAPSLPDNPWLSEFHNMRGFFISDARSPGQGPQLEMAKAGDKLTLQARVHNFSLTAMDDGSKVHARFYGMTWNNSNNMPIGDSFLIGEDVLPPIPKFSSDPGADLNYVYAKTNFDTTPYQDKFLVFWVVVWTEKADGTLAPEIANHGLTAIPGALTKLSDVPVETTTITDNTNTTKTVSFSNNVGFYKSAFYVSAPSSAEAKSPVQNESGDVRLGQVKVSERKIAQGQATEVSALLRTRAKSASGVSVVFYDGDPQQGGKAFDVEKISHLRARDAHEVKVPFRSNSCGEHQIFVSVGKGKPYEVTDSSRTIKVQCAKPPQCETNCFRSPQYYLNNLWGKLPKGEVWIAGATAPVSTRNVWAISQALKGGNSAVKSFNREYVAAQLSMLDGGSVGQRQREVLGSKLSCYGLDAGEVVLSNGAQIGTATTLRELLGQAEWAARAGRRADLEKLAGVLGSLNSDDPNGACGTSREVTLGPSSPPQYANQKSGNRSSGKE